jgi:hypothetical protein
MSHRRQLSHSTQEAGKKDKGRRRRKKFQENDQTIVSLIEGRGVGEKES